MSSHIDAFEFSFVPRTVTDWNALPASTRANKSIDAFNSLHKFPDIPADRCWVVPLQQSSSNGWSPIAGYSLKNWRIEERSILLLVALAPDLPMRILSVLFSVPVDACCHKQSLMRDCLRDKRTSTLRAINYFTVENVNDTPPVIDAKPLVENRDRPRRTLPCVAHLHTDTLHQSQTASQSVTSDN